MKRINAATRAAESGRIISGLWLVDPKRRKSAWRVRETGRLFWELEKAAAALRDHVQEYL